MRPLRGRRTRIASAVPAVPVLLLVGAGLAGGPGCNDVFDVSAYHVEADSLDASPDTTTDPSQFEGGAGVAPGEGGAIDACVAGTDRRTLENACTAAECAPYGGSVPSCDGGLCALPPPVDAGTPASDAGAPGADGGAADAGVTKACSAVGSDSAHIIYVTGSTALQGFIDEVSKVLATEPENPVTVVYQASGSCVGVKSAVDPANNLMVPSLGATTYYDASGDLQPCALDPGGVVADIGASDVFYSTCYLGQAATPALPQSVSENFGPVQIMNFAVPQGSTEHSISLSAAYYVFGFGGAGYPIAPWTDPTQIQIRSAASGTQSMIGAAIGVPPSLWQGVPHATSGGVGTALVAAGQSGDPDVVSSAIGILASDYLVQNAQSLRGLAVQDDNAGCGYFPNSTATARDNANARDGHYPLWGPSHFYARIDTATQLPLKPGVSQFIDGLSGVTALPGLDLVAEYASKGLVPLCAMHASRSSDGADFTPYKAPITCNCYFDLIATGATSCSTCNTNADCPGSAPNCNKFGAAPQQGYCDL